MPGPSRLGHFSVAFADVVAWAFCFPGMSLSGLVEHFPMRECL